jgi:plasmid maintenance system antidote protein VapI
MLPLPQSAWATRCADLGLTQESFSTLLGLTSARVPEIRRARKIANEAGASLATYGGTSREHFMCKKIRQLGSIQAYET